MDQQIAMELADVILRQGDRIIGVEDRLHDLGVAGDLLLIARGERADPDIGQQLLNLPVAEPGALDPGRGTDAFYGGDAAQPRQAFRRDPSDRPPSALELVDLGDQRQDFWRDAACRGVARHALYPSVYTHFLQTHS